MPACFALGLGFTCLVLFLCFEVNGRTFEGHRFLTATRIVTPVVALLSLGKFQRISVGPLLLALPVLAGVFATLGYFCSRLPDYGAGFRQITRQYEANCRVEYNARLGDQMQPTWVDQPIWFEYTGCRPVYAAPHSDPGDIVLVGWPEVGAAAFSKMDDTFFPRDEPARMVCSPHYQYFNRRSLTSLLEGSQHEVLALLQDPDVDNLFQRMAPRLPLPGGALLAHCIRLFPADSSIAFARVKKP